MPLQIEPLLTDRVGLAFTVKLLTAVFVPTQPNELVPVTEYEKTPMVGVTIVVPPDITYIDAPLGLMVKDCPSQIAPLFTFMVGEGLTITVDKAELLQS